MHAWVIIEKLELTALVFFFHHLLIDYSYDIDH